MADNTLLNLGSGGDTIASDDIGGIKFQRVKLIHGTDGTNAGDVSSTNGIPVQGMNVAATTGSWTSATALNTAVSISVAGMNAVSVAIVTTSTFTGGVVTFEVSPDNTNWFTVSMARIDSYTVETTYTLVATTSRAWTTSVDGFTNFRVKLSSVITGTGTASVFVVPQVFSIEPIVAVGQATAASLNATATLAAGTNIVGRVGIDQTTPGTTNLVQVGGTLPTGANTIGAVNIAASQTIAVTQATAASLNVTATQQTITKGSQGATGITTQDLKDAGRSTLCFYATGAASGTTTTETAISLTKSAGTAANSTAASFVITSGKTFRITGIQFAQTGHATATTASTVFKLRINTAGAVITSSTPIVIQVRIATPATSLAFQNYIVPIGEGYEIAGNGTIQFGVTAAATFTTNAPTWDVHIIGYEY